MKKKRMDVKMLIRVIEKCLVKNLENKEEFAFRTYFYESDGLTLLEAIEDYTKNFDIDNVIDCHDDFEGECLESTVVKIEQAYDVV